MKQLSFIVFLLVASLGSEAQFRPSQIAASAEKIVDERIIYDPSYFSIPYPNGDVPADRGVCTDVVIRTYRVLGVDLQQRVHEDMMKSFDAYPARWGLKRPDTNIDHRRVPNLMTFFERHGSELPLNDYQPGDIVCWNLGNGVLHIGIVSSEKGASGDWKVVHNIGGGQVIEDVLSAYQQIGHYRYLVE